MSPQILSEYLAVIRSNSDTCVVLYFGLLLIVAVWLYVIAPSRGDK